jgi:threonine dehydrogenase-like Zn-dependent dehydrogenase
METLTLEKAGKFRLHKTFPPGKPAAGEVLVRVHQVGICGTDLHAYCGNQPFFTYPRILGHELGVEVLAAGDGVSGLSRGMRGAVEPYLYCGNCAACRRGKTNCCSRLKVLGVHLDGGMREEMIIPAQNLHTSSIFEADQLALVETLGIGRHAVERAAVRRDERLLLLGAGPIGLSVLQFARHQTDHLLLADIKRERLAFAQAHFHFEGALRADEAEFAQHIRECWQGEGPDIIIDATGNPASMHRCPELAAQGARIVFVGLYAGDFTFHDPLFHRKELSLMSSRNSLGADFRHIIAEMEAGRIDTSAWITHRLRLDVVPERFPSLLRPEAKVVKAMVNLSGE